jgi:RNA-directed DNA polymerase
MTEDARTEGQVGHRRVNSAAVNGPEDDVLDWGSVDWPEVESKVRRLRQRIFTASQAGDLAKVPSLQKLMLRSRANALLSVRRVTELNAGRMTAGVDGVTVVTAPGKAALAERVRSRGAKLVARPVKRVYVPKANGKQRPLGIPVIVDRVRQAQVVNALEPEWEARFEPKSYGFRPGRGCHDAIEAIFHVARGANPHRRWILDADLAAAFDRIDHSHLLAQLGTFPARDEVKRWLKAGVVEKGRLSPTEEGTPQGSLCSAAHKPPCGVPRSRCCKVPSGSCSGAASHRLTYSTTHGSGECASTALTTRSQGTVSKNFSTSRSMTQSFFQHRCRHAATASRAFRFGR